MSINDFTRQRQAGVAFGHSARLGKAWRLGRVLLVAALLNVVAGPPTALASTAAQQLHARAVESFRQGRFPEAYGRFVQLANAGHPPAARIALWMCEHGPDLFGKDWDCATEEVIDWATVARVPPPQIGPRLYPAVSPPSTRPSTSRAAPRQVGQAGPTGKP
jgi:hypothetical protein